MKFFEFEEKMKSIGVGSLAGIARKLDTTPQAVSNWKSRDQVPLHVEAKINSYLSENDEVIIQRQVISESKEVTFSDIIITLAEQFKIIILFPVLAIFISFSYVQFIQMPEYESSAKILLPENKLNSMGGIAGLASQFGVNVPMGGANSADLSSPTLYPELLKSRTFADKILFKEFYIEKFSTKLKLINILTLTKEQTNIKEDVLIEIAVEKLNSEVLQYEKDPLSAFSTIKVTTFDPQFSKDLADAVLIELEKLNRFFKTQTTNEKVNFIEDRISSVKIDLDISEKKLKEFNEKNRQISSPALELAQERLSRDMDVQRGIYLTLKQQLELAKIEQIQEVSIVQVLDRPVVPLSPSNKNTFLAIILSFILGICFSITIAFSRSYLNNSDIDERKKLRRGKHFFRKKTKDFMYDKRVSGSIGIIMTLFSPLYFGSVSNNPTFLGIYSTYQAIINIIYLCAIFICVYLFTRKKTKEIF